MSSTLKFPSRLKGIAVALALAVPTFAVIGATTLASADPAAVRLAGKSQPADAAARTVPAGPVAAPPVRTVTLIRPTTELWPDQIEASGNIMPWQESHIGTEIGGMRLASVLVGVGDTVKKGQVLARLNAATIETDLDTADAQLAEAEAALAQAAATLERAKRLVASGGVSQQELTLYETQKHTAEAKRSAARAVVKRQQLRLDLATLVAPDDGVISYCAASEGAIVQTGSELFRLIRQGRLEWRAEVKGETLLRLSAGQEAVVRSPLGTEVRGRVRQLSPTIDLTSRNGMVYVDLPAETNLKPGLNVSGTIGMGKRKALVLPATAVQRLDHEARVLKVDANGRVEPVEVRTGRVKDDSVEIVAGLDERALVVAKDLKLLKAGELVKASTSASEAEN